MNYGNMTHADLLSLRDRLGPNDPRQAKIAPYEHAAFAREWTQDQPWKAIPSLTFAIPAYTAAKALGIQKARSPASIAEMMMGYRGMGQGIASLFRR